MPQRPVPCGAGVLRHRLVSFERARGEDRELLMSVEGLCARSLWEIVSGDVVYPSTLAAAALGFSGLGGRNPFPLGLRGPGRLPVCLPSLCLGGQSGRGPLLLGTGCPTGSWGGFGISRPVELSQCRQRTQMPAQGYSAHGHWALRDKGRVGSTLVCVALVLPVRCTQRLVRHSLGLVPWTGSAGWVRLAARFVRSAGG